MEKKIDFNIELNYFDLSEFDQPGKPGSGKENMDINLLMIIDNMRNKSGIPYKITSGYRDEKYNASIGGVKNSSHCKGLAVDIAAPTSKAKFLIIEAALHFGIQRIGVGSNFIHIDIDDIDKPAQVCWTY
tara:strand:+ start:14733 stop:15122 length:390 start_codon:yes stop_codon:yes gene_type:complete